MPTSNKYRNWVHLDFWVQSAMFAFMVLISLRGGGIVFFFMAIPIGAWQLFSGAVCFLAFEQSNRKPYLLAALALIIVFTLAIASHNRADGFFLLMMIVLCLWNYLLTLSDFVD